MAKVAKISRDKNPSSVTVTVKGTKFTFKGTKEASTAINMMNPHDSVSVARAQAARQYLKTPEAKADFAMRKTKRSEAAERIQSDVVKAVNKNAKNVVAAAKGAVRFAKDIYNEGIDDAVANVDWAGTGEGLIQFYKDSKPLFSDVWDFLNA